MRQEQNAQTLVRAIAQHQAGDLDGAASLYRQVLATEPGNAKALAMLGLERLQRGALQEGRDLLRASLEEQPEQPDVLNNLGRALQLMGDHEAALEALEQALTLAPNYLGALFNRGNVLHDLKRYEAAAASFEQAVALQPSHMDARLNLGIALKELGCKQEALAQFDQVAIQTPYRADVHCNRGLLLQEMCCYREALASFEKAVRLAPELVEAINGAGVVLRKLKRLAEALQCHEQAIRLSPGDVQAHCQYGVVLQELGRYEEALKSYDHAIAFAPDDPTALILRAELYAEQGRMQEAERDLDVAVGLAPENPAAYALLVSLRKYSEDDQQFRQLESLYAKRQKLRQTEATELCFTMGRALEKQGRHDEAFSAYAEGNHLCQIGRPNNEEAEVKLLDWIISTFDHALFGEYRQAAADLPLRPDSRTPIFIVGMPRSGSTLIEQILASHPHVFGAGELPTMPQTIMANQLFEHIEADRKISLSNLRQMGQQYLDEVWKLAPDAHYITDKMPNNFRYLGLIHLMLPDAKFIHVMRNPMDACFSCYALHFGGELDFTCDLGQLGRYYRRYAELMRHWHCVLPSERILDVRYEGVVADIETQVRHILDYLDLPWDSACLEFYEAKRPVSTASVAQVRQPIYSSSVARWKNFEKHLGPLMEILGQTVLSSNEHA